jgi:hypothetical protein
MEEIRVWNYKNEVDLFFDWSDASIGCGPLTCTEGVVLSPKETYSTCSPHVFHGIRRVSNKKSRNSFGLPKPDWAGFYWALWTSRRNQHVPILETRLGQFFLLALGHCPNRPRTVWPEPFFIEFCTCPQILSFSIAFDFQVNLWLPPSTHYQWDDKGQVSKYPLLYGDSNPACNRTQ